MDTLPTGYSELKITKIGKREVKLLEDWYTPYGKVPKDFVSDGASIPRVLWWFTHPFGELFEGSVLHDLFYKYPEKDKAFADNCFKETVKAYQTRNNTSSWKIGVAYWFVRHFGRGNYR